MPLDYEQNDFEDFEFDGIERRKRGPGGIDVGPGDLNVPAARLLQESGWPLVRLAYAKSPEYRGDDSRIFYGKWPAKLDKDRCFDEIVAVGDRTGFWASGIRIDKDFVLTAGHVHAMGGREKISLEHELSQDKLCVREPSAVSSDGHEFGVARSLRHPGFWNEPFFRHDLALLKLKDDPAPPPPPAREFATAKEFFEAEIGLLVGYGGADACGCGGKYTEYGARKVVPIPILHEWTIARERYFHQYWGYEPKYEFIASSPLLAADACVGDSGAGLYVPVCPKGKGTPILDETHPRFFVCLHTKDTDDKKVGRENAAEEGAAHEVEFKLAGMVSRQFGLGGDRCGAGSIYLKLFWGLGTRGTEKTAPPAEATSSYDADAPLEDEGAEYYEACVEAMKWYLNSKEGSESELLEACCPSGYGASEGETSRSRPQ